MNVTSGLRIGRVRGIDIRVHWSWAFIAGLLVWSLAEGVFGPQHGWGPAARWSAAAITAALVFGSILLHELSHSLVAQRAGMRVRAITLFIFGGVSSTTDEMPSAGQEFRVAIAGPLMSGGLALVFGAIWLMTRGIGIAPVFGYLALINLGLGAFNLLPGFPLDGGRVLRSLLWARTGDQERATAIAARVGSAIGMVLIGVGVVNAFAFSLVAGAWYALIGYFLVSAARGAAALVRVDELLEETNVARLMHAPSTIEASATVSELVDTQTRRGERAEIVEGARGPVGVVTVTDVAGRPRSTWDQVRVEQIMVPEGQLVTVGAGSSVRTAMQLMGERGVRQLPVVSEDGRIVGIVTLDDVEHFVRNGAERSATAGSAVS